MKNLTEEQIRQMAAGRVLDILVCELVFNKSYSEDLGFGLYAKHNDEFWATKVPNYSTNISDAWKIVEHLTKSLDEIITDEGEKYGFWTLDRLGFDCCEKGEPDTDGVHGQYRCNLARNKNEEIREDVWCTADTAPLAICKCALLAKLKG